MNCNIWKLCLSLLLGLQLALPTEVARAEGPQYFYDDIPRFFAAYDRYLASGEAVVLSDYFAAGSTGLKNFESHFALTSENLAETLDKYPGFFGSIRDLEDTTREQQPAIDAMFERLQAMFPDQEMPDVYFLVGGRRAGGQAGDGNYVMVAAELYTTAPGVDTSEFRPDARLFTPNDILYIVAHEAAHVIQENLQGAERYLSIYTQPEAGTLMAYSLREGAANLVAQLVAGGHINATAEAYGLQHERELWSVFREEALETELGDWFFYRPKQHPEWPRDLGYWMGYRMASKCYEAAADKPAMLRRILMADDPAAFLQECALFPDST